MRCDEEICRSLSTQASLELLGDIAPGWWARITRRNRFDGGLPAGGASAPQRDWSNVLATTVPDAPDMSIVCMHG